MQMSKPPLLSRRISSLNIPQSTKENAEKAGFLHLHDVWHGRLDGLALNEVLELHDSEAILANIQTLRLQPKSVRKNAVKGISTSCRDLDAILGGGVPFGLLTEVYGPPGIGKTQLAMQLCVNLQLLRSGEQDAYAFFIDTEGSCFMDRFEQMANAVSQRSGMDAQDILSRIRVIRILDYDELEELLKALPNMVRTEESVRFIAFDSFAFHFRYGFADMGRKSRALHDAAKVLRSLACEDDIAILLVNHLTSSSDRSGDTPLYIPALGESWGHASNIRLELSWDESSRQACIKKSSYLSNGVARFQISLNGICDDANS